MTNPPAGKTEDEPDAPDGGWGWVVAFASFMVHIVTDGVTYSFGILYLEFLNYFDEGAAATAWIASILVGVTYCSGPLSSILVNKYGCQAVTIAGAVLGGVSLIISMFATNVLTLYFTIGIGAGLGFGLIYLPAIVSVTCWFKKKRSMATGIAVAGSGLGTFIFSPLTDYLVREFGWRGALLIIAALVFQCTTFGALFRPVEEVKVQKVEVEVKKNGLPLVERHRNGSVPMQRPLSVGNLPYPLVPQAQASDSGKLTVSLGCLTKSNLEPQKRFQSSHQPLRRSGGIMNRSDVLYCGSFHNLPREKSVRLEHEDKLMPLIGELQKNEEKEEKTPMLDFSLFKDPIFIVFTVSNFCTSIGFNVPYVYIVAQAKSRDVANADFILSVIGIANTVGRLVLGYICDKTSEKTKLWIYNGCLTICGIATALSAFCNNFFWFAVYGSVFGFSIGAYVGLTSVILVDLLGLDKLTNAFGMLLLFQGIASLVGPPIAGWLYDGLQSYNPGFFLAGSMIAASGLMLFVIPTMQRRIARRNLSVGIN